MDHSTFRSEHPSTRIEQAPEAAEAAIVPEGDQGDQGDVDDYEQLRLRLWTSVPVDGPARPERALYRELFDIAGLVGTARLVGWEIASWTDRRGKCQIRIDKLTDALKVTSRTIKTAISEIRRTGALRTHQTGRSLIFELALQGRFHTARRPRKPAAGPQPRLPLLSDTEVKSASPHEVKSASPRIFKGLYGKGKIKISEHEPKAVADPPRERDADQRQQQQPQIHGDKNHDKSKSHGSENHDGRIEGLIAYLAIASRRPGRAPFDEGMTRDDIAAGRTTVLDLQIQADRIRAEDDQIRRKAHDAAQRQQRREAAEDAWTPAAAADANPIAVLEWTSHVLTALRRGVLNRRHLSARGRDAGIVDPAAEITTIMRIRGDDDEAPQVHEQAASATPTRGAGAGRAEPAEPAQVEPA